VIGTESTRSRLWAVSGWAEFRDIFRLRLMGKTFLDGHTCCLFWDIVIYMSIVSFSLLRYLSNRSPSPFFLLFFLVPLEDARAYSACA
jgi:hypothetical protein